MTKEDLINFEEDIKAEFLAGKIRCPVHFSRGNEDALLKIFQENDIANPNNWCFSTHRSHFHALLKGIPPKWLKEQILKGNSMHIMSQEYKFMASSIVGGCLPIAVGVACAIKRKELNEKVFAFLGDMASLTGIAHECMLYSDVNELPISFVIEDNGLSTNTPTYEAWGAPYICYPDFHNVIYYEYIRGCEHINVNSFVEFK